jgi:riboflavin kinase/FMN adenylyltransferase
MQILRDISACPEALKGAVLAIGNFDGVHRGHQAVLRTALDTAGASGTPSGAMTFEPHPRSFFHPEKALFRLTPEALKLSLFEALGFQMAVVLPFDAALAVRPAVEFVKVILVEGLNVSHVIAGNDFHFGKGRDGTPEMLRKLGREHGFEVTIVAPQGSGEGVFSSTQIRTCLRQGDPRSAANILGYWWRVSGKVIGGDKRGHGLGFPTANIDVPEGFQLKHGIYAVRVRTDGGTYHGAAYLGTRPSFDDGAPVIETFLFGYSGDLYGQEIELEVIEFLRDDRKFDDPGALIGQMRADCEEAEKVLAALERSDPFGSGLLGGAPDGC